MTIELRHPGRQLWRLQAVSTPDAVRSYEHFGQRRHHIDIDGALTLDAIEQAAVELGLSLALAPTDDDMGPHDPRRTP